MSSLTTIKSQIYTIIDDIKATALIHTVYLGMPITLNGTPAVVIDDADGGESIFTTDENEVDTKVVARVIVDNTSDQAGQKALLTTVVDSITAELRKNDHETLSGNCFYFVVENRTAVDYDETETLKVMFMDIIMRVKYLKSISTP